MNARQGENNIIYCQGKLLTLRSHQHVKVTTDGIEINFLKTITILGGQLLEGWAKKISPWFSIDFAEELGINVF